MTIKANFAQLFAKTCTRNEVDLVRLAMSAVAPAALKPGADEQVGPILTSREQLQDISLAT
jgi:hypothetical protein